MRMRLYYFLAVVIVIVLGISSREFANSLPRFVSENFGDGLWACMVYLGVRAVFIRKSLPWALWFSFLFCFGIEFSQLYQAEWIREIRSSLIGSLILGKGFLLIDLVRYTVGILLIYSVDRFINRSSYFNSKR